jgi:gamma-glutamylcyclotransferase (GGCT)/AIG2-like uncharacterized protein YtfP
MKITRSKKIKKIICQAIINFICFILSVSIPLYIFYKNIEIVVWQTYYEERRPSYQEFLVAQDILYRNIKENNTIKYEQLKDLLNNLRNRMVELNLVAPQHIRQACFEMVQDYIEFIDMLSKYNDNSWEYSKHSLPQGTTNTCLIYIQADMNNLRKSINK